MQFFGGGTMASASGTGRPMSVQPPEQKKRDDGGSKGGGKTYCRSSRGLGGRADCAVCCATTLTVYARIGKGKEARAGRGALLSGHQSSLAPVVPCPDQQLDDEQLRTREISSESILRTWSVPTTVGNTPGSLYHQMNEDENDRNRPLRRKMPAGPGQTRLQGVSYGRGAPA
ncbi:hypothetical protein CSOJ01_11728 [Colletotrichum sojae]|uniref:Uncharacterized protein n=1 Tax=Colletotrichum sojae TaxID=2175907 RepID=A0A8H6IWS0_9PEZI|nr:hypothetical protein CSOJ01_11728 [Colletotrichum sojae]